MRNWKWSLILGVFSIVALSIYISFYYPVSNGKRIGNLTKLSLKGKILKTWEGTLNEGYGDKLTTYFSISDEKLAQELYEHEGREVVIYYDEHFHGWPNDTNYNVTKWHPFDPKDSLSGEKNEDSHAPNTQLEAIKLISKELQQSLFCSLLGTLVLDQELYAKVKARVEKTNPFLFEKMKECNHSSTTTLRPTP
jgi:hypothetical protein